MAASDSDGGGDDAALDATATAPAIAGDAHHVTPLGDTAAATPDSLGSTPVVVRGTPAILAAGAKIGRYVVIEHLGSGGMGAVYRARDPELGRDLAVKTLHPHLADQRARLLREGQAIARLVHPNVVTIHDVGTHGGGGDLFIAMEYIDGTDLRRWLAGEMGSTPRGPAAILAKFALAGRGLAAAHEAGLVHRDFKPDNVLVHRTTGRTIVTDFGLARAGAADDDRDRSAGTAAHASLPNLTQTGAMAGTPLYMAPEQFTGDPLTPACDQFSYCVALYEALYGVRPFPGTTLDAIMTAVTTADAAPPPARAGVPEPVRAALVRGLARDPDHRHPSMSALVDAIVASPPPAPRKKFRAVAIASTIALTAAGVGLYVKVSQTASAPELTPPVVTYVNSCNADQTRSSLERVSPSVEVKAQVDAWIDAWQPRHDQACATHSQKVVRCLDNAATALQTAILSKSDGWLALPPVDRCDAPPIALRDLDGANGLGRYDNVAVAPDGAHYAFTRDGALFVAALGVADLPHLVPIPDGWVLEGFRDATHVVGRPPPATTFTTIDISGGTVAPYAKAPVWQVAAANASFTAGVALRDADDLVVLAFDGKHRERSLDRVAALLAAAWSPSEAAIATIVRTQTADTAPELVIHSAFDTAPHIERLALRGRPDYQNTFALAWPDEHHLVVTARGPSDEALDLWQFTASDRGWLGPTKLLTTPARHALSPIAIAGGRAIAALAEQHYALAKLVDDHLEAVSATGPAKLHIESLMNGSALRRTSPDGKLEAQIRPTGIDVVPKSAPDTAATKFFAPADPDCRVLAAAWRDVATMVVATSCRDGDTSTLLEVTPGKPPRTLYTGMPWSAIIRVAVDLTNGTIFVDERTNTRRIVSLDNLAAPPSP